jgi:outer membrane biosynthesis protein TonB
LTEGVIPLGVPDGSEEEGALPEALPEQAPAPDSQDISSPPSVQEALPEPAAPPAPEPVALPPPAVETPPPLPAEEKNPEPTAPAIEEKPVAEAQSPPKKTPPEKKKEPDIRKKLDALVGEVGASSEDFLSVLKDVERRKPKKPAKASSGKGAGKGGQARKGMAGGAQEGTLSAGEKDLIRQQIYPHWSIPGGVAEAENLVVELRIQLREDGTVTDVQILDSARLQRDPLYRAAAESARRAVRLASPLKIPPNRAELLRSLRLRFNPKEALS